MSIVQQIRKFAETENKAGNGSVGGTIHGENERPESED